MTNKSALKQGESLIQVVGKGGLPCHTVGSNKVESITVTKLAGPMGWYDCALVRYEDGHPDQIHPLHMMENILTAPLSAREGE
jgi:hypothetical protein